VRILRLRMARRRNSSRASACSGFKSGTRSHLDLLLTGSLSGPFGQMVGPFESSWRPECDKTGHWHSTLTLSALVRGSNPEQANGSLVGAA
jgi:hypothetical protein